MLETFLFNNHIVLGPFHCAGNICRYILPLFEHHMFDDSFFVLLASEMVLYCLV